MLALPFAVLLAAAVPLRPVNTYSIVARDAATGELGVAVQSHWFSVGSVVPWARPGVGAVATQAAARIDYGPRALELMADGLSASEALATLVGVDPGGASRQVAIVAADGESAAWTGAECMAFAADVSDRVLFLDQGVIAAEGSADEIIRKPSNERLVSFVSRFNH